MAKRLVLVRQTFNTNRPIAGKDVVALRIQWDNTQWLYWGGDISWGGDVTWNSFFAKFLPLINALSVNGYPIRAMQYGQELHTLYVNEDSQPAWGGSYSVETAADGRDTWSSATGNIAVGTTSYPLLVPKTFAQTVRAARSGAV